MCLDIRKVKSISVNYISKKPQVPFKRGNCLSTPEFVFIFPLRVLRLFITSGATTVLACIHSVYYSSGFCFEI